MQKSFHILLLRPFYKNIRKELAKMPKIYFFDSGLRNFLVNNFDPVPIRSDRGILLENSVIRQLAERSGLLVEEKVKFWRYRTGAEVDMIFDEKIAFEIKYDCGSLKMNKYRMFFELYPEVEFNLVSLAGTSRKRIPVWEPWLL
jgi:hypothetical protein